jgi:hypothetical protein
MNLFQLKNKMKTLVMLVSVLAVALAMPAEEKPAEKAVAASAAGGEGDEVFEASESQSYGFGYGTKVADEYSVSTGENERILNNLCSSFDIFEINFMPILAFSKRFKVLSHLIKPKKVKNNFLYGLFFGFFAVYVHGFGTDDKDYYEPSYGHPHEPAPYGHPAPYYGKSYHAPAPYHAGAPHHNAGPYHHAAPKYGTTGYGYGHINEYGNAGKYFKHCYMIFCIISILSKI